MNDDARIALHKAVENWRKHRGGNRFEASHPQVAGRGVGEILDRPDPLFQFIERRDAAVEHGPRIHRRLHAARAAFEKGYPERALQIGDHARHGGLRKPKLHGRLGHAAALADGEKNMQVAQPDAATDLMLAVEFLSHAYKLANRASCCNLRVWDSEFYR